jgi:hypothetical protein
MTGVGIESFEGTFVLPDNFTGFEGKSIKCGGIGDGIKISAW